jgi:formate dehydrogenase subunit beta
VIAKHGLLAVENAQYRLTINAFLQRLLSQEIVKALLVPMRHPAGDVTSHALVTRPGQLEHADVLAPTMPVNGARIISSMTRITAANTKIAVVLKPCELRALIELVKLKQASLDNLVLIGIDCHGVYPMQTYSRIIAEKTSDDFVKSAEAWQEDSELRTACQICGYPVPMTADLTIGMFGLDPGNGLLLRANTQLGGEILTQMELASTDADPLDKKREQIVSKRLSEREEQRQKFFDQTGEDISGHQQLSALLAPCIGCHNCMTVCPVCYCRECLFESPTFELEADRYLGIAEKRGALGMPTDTLLFHLTRMTHMASSCVGCGACEDGCPNDIPLLKIFQLVGDRVQKLFDYVPGRSLEDELPMATFREDELHSIGE